MKFIITETQKKQLIKYHLHEDDKVEDKVEDKVGDKVDDKSENDLTGTTVGSIMTKVIDYVKKSLQNDTKGSSSNSKGSGNLGNIKLTGSFGGDAKNNISLLIDAMKDKGITDPLTQIGILSVIKKESNFIPKGEVSYAGTDNSRIRSIFGSRVRNFTDEQLNRLKTNAKQFFNTVYANTVGNLAGDDGWNFRGRGFNQLTGRKNYKKYGNIIGVDLENNPDLLNQNDVASKVAIEFLTKGKKDFPKFNTKEEAATYFADINAGGSTASSHRDKAIEASKSFDVA